MNRKLPTAIALGVFLIAATMAYGFQAGTVVSESFGVQGWVQVTHLRDGQVLSFQESHNVITTTGVDVIAEQIGSTSPATNGGNYIALTNNTDAASSSSTTLTGEITRTTTQTIRILETLNVSPAAISFKNFYATITEAIQTTDAIQRIQSIARTLTQPINLNFVTQRTTEISRGLSDAVSVAVQQLQSDLESRFTPTKVVVIALMPKLISEQAPLILDARENLNVEIKVNSIDEAAQFHVTPVTQPEIDTPPPPSTTFIVAPVEIEIEELDAETAATFNATIRLYYTQEELLATGLQASELSLFTYNETIPQWIAVPSTVNEEEQYIEALTSHFSKWTIMGKPITAAGLFDVIIGMGDIMSSLQKLYLMPQSDIVTALTFTNMGGEPSNLVVKYWLTNPQGETVLSRTKSMMVNPSQTTSLPIEIATSAPGTYKLSTQIIADGVESEQVARTYQVTSLDIYGFMASILIAIVGAVAAVTYTQKRSRPIPSQKARFEYPL